VTFGWYLAISLVKIHPEENITDGWYHFQRGFLLVQNIKKVKLKAGPMPRNPGYLYARLERARSTRWMGKEKSQIKPGMVRQKSPG